MTDHHKTPTKRLLDIRTLYHEPAILDYPRAQEILARFPHAERIVVPSHWNIPGLHGNEGSADDLIRVKRTLRVLGVKKTHQIRINGRSGNFIATSHANGCALACSYCGCH